MRVIVVVEWNRRSILHGVDDFDDVVQTGDDFDDNLVDDAQIGDGVGVGVGVDECCLFDASHNVDHHYDDVDHYDDESDGSMMTGVGCIFGPDDVVDGDENNQVESSVVVVVVVDVGDDDEVQKMTIMEENELEYLQMMMTLMAVENGDDDDDGMECDVDVVDDEKSVMVIDVQPQWEQLLLLLLLVCEHHLMGEKWW